MRHLAWIFLLVSGHALAQVDVVQAWARATAPGATVAGGFMTLVNKGAGADRLVAASSPAAERVELHTHLHEGGVMKMRQVDAVDVPAGGRTEFKPGGLHLMFINIRHPFKEGSKVPVTLKFEKAGEVKAEYAVGGLGAMAPGGSGHGHHMKH